MKFKSETHKIISFRGPYITGFFNISEKLHYGIHKKLNEINITTYLKIILYIEKIDAKKSYYKFRTS
jgi:hypothetical protein